MYRALDELSYNLTKFYSTRHAVLVVPSFVKLLTKSGWLLRMTRFGVGELKS